MDDRNLHNMSNIDADLEDDGIVINHEEKETVLDKGTSQNPSQERESLEQEIAKELEDDDIIFKTSKESETTPTDEKITEEQTQKINNPEKPQKPEQTKTAPINIEKEITPEISKQEDPDLKRLRTFEDDVKNIVQSQNISTSDMVMAEQNKKLSKLKSAPQANFPNQDNSSVSTPEGRQSFSIGKREVLILLSIIFFIAGSGAIFFGYQSFQNRPERKVLGVETSNFFVADNFEYINSKNKLPRNIVADIRNLIKLDEFENQSISEIVITKEIDLQKEDEIIKRDSKISSGDFFTILESRASEELIRSFQNNQLMFGIHKIDGVPEPFIILKSNDLDQTYAGLLKWETFMIDDVRNIFFRNLGSGQVFENDATERINYNVRDIFVEIPQILNPEIEPGATTTEEDFINDPEIRTYDLR
jgi:outer membrane biosynthesis protein TonB